MVSPFLFPLQPTTAMAPKGGKKGKVSKEDQERLAREEVNS